MAQVIDIRELVTNELPLIQITDELTVAVNNRKSNVLAVQGLYMQEEEKAKKGKKSLSESEMMDTVLGMLIGEKNVIAINEMDLPTPSYKVVFDTILNVATGTYGKDTPNK